MRIFVKICKIVLCLSLVTLLSSCSNVKIMPSAIVSEALAGCTLPSGQVYTLWESEQGDRSDEDTFRLLFDEYETGMTGVRCSAVYLAARERLCEMGVFLCYGDTMDTVDMCQRRGELLVRSDKDVQYMTSVKGKYVLFAVGEHPETLLAALSRAVDG